jgi:hypothetical protein
MEDLQSNWVATMPIDDPISAVQALNASDDRQRSPVPDLAGHFLRVVRLFAPKEADIPIAALESAVGWLDRQRAENREQFVDSIAEELKFRANQIERLLTESEERRRFMADQMPGLVVDGLRRAEQTRATERVRRLGRVLVHAVEVGPRDGADYAEEMLRIAAELAEREIAVLNEMKRAYPRSIAGPTNERYFHLMAARPFERIKWRELGFPPQELESICCKLQSFGLVGRVDSLVPYRRLEGQRSAYELLRKGWDFVEYIRTSAGEGR